jgi:hypothetical protein
MGVDDENHDGPRGRQAQALAVTFTLTVVMTSAVPEVIPLEHCKVFLAGRRRVDRADPDGASAAEAAVGEQLARLQSDLLQERDGEAVPKTLHLVQTQQSLR